MSRVALRRVATVPIQALVQVPRPFCSCATYPRTPLRQHSLVAYLARAPIVQAARGLSTEIDSRSLTYGDQRRAYPISKKRSVRTLPLSVKHRDALVLNRRGMAIYTQEYMPAVDEPTAYVFMCHDYGDHSSWFLRDLAVSLVEQGYGVYAMDLEGHGRSDGVHGHITNLNEAVNDLIDHFGDKNLQHQDKKCFLLGEGMGAALALRAYINQGLKIWDGMVMISPMLILPRRFRPKPRFLKLIRHFASKLDHLRLSNLRTVAHATLREPNRRQEILEDVLGMHSLMDVGTMLRIMDGLDDLHTHFQDLRVPLLVLHGEDDQIHDLNASLNLYKTAKSLDKTYKTYTKMQHSLLGGESLDNVSRVYDDLHDWLRERTAEPLDDESFEAMEADEQESVGEEQRVHRGGVVQSVRTPRGGRPTVIESWSPTKPTVPTHTVPKP